MISRAIENVYFQESTTILSAVYGKWLVDDHVRNPSDKYNFGTESSISSASQQRVLVMSKSTVFDAKRSGKRPCGSPEFMSKQLKESRTGRRGSYCVQETRKVHEFLLFCIRRPHTLGIPFAQSPGVQVSKAGASEGIPEPSSADEPDSARADVWPQVDEI